MRIFSQADSIGRVLLPAAVTALCSAPLEATVTRYLTGNAADVAPTLHGPAYDLGGGGADVDPAIQWMIDQVRGCTTCSTKVDVVVLRSSGSNGYNAAIYAMNGVDSVETLVLTTAADADRTDVETTVRNAEVVFFAGGDQCTYVSIFKGTRVETAVESVVSKGGAVGGTSAGTAIQGPFVYDACGGSVTSSQALSDPYRSDVTFTYGFFDWPNLQNVLTDTHFVTRDRMGRTLTFLARQIQDGRAASPLGVAIDQGTSLVIDRFGMSTVMGASVVYMVLADHLPEVCQAGSALTYSGFKIWKLASGDQFDLASRPSCGYYRRSVTNGALSADPYGGTPEPCGNPPSISGFSPASGPEGTSVSIAGASFDGATTVAFGGVSASFTLASSTQLTASVPAGAVTGPIRVTTPLGTATSASTFTVTPSTPPPSISSFSPTSGPAGTSVTITGSSFGGTTAVTFGGVAASFTLTSASQIAATAPAGAVTGPIGVTTPYGTTASATSFVVTSGGSFAEQEPNDSRTQANDVSGLAFPLTVTGVIGSAGDADYFKVTLAGKQKLSVSLAVPACCDYDLYLLGSTGSTVARSTRDGAGVAEALSYTNSRSSTQTFYVELVRYSGSGGAYTMNVAKP